MRHLSTQIITLLILLTTWTSCNKCELDDDEMTVLRITSGINLELDTVYGQLCLKSRTNKVYGYSGNYLQADVFQTGNSFEVVYKCIHKSKVGLMTLSPASHWLRFENIDYFDDINLTFRLKGIKYSGQIKNGELTLKRQGGIKLKEI